MTKFQESITKIRSLVADERKRTPHDSTLDAIEAITDALELISFQIRLSREFMPEIF